MSTPDRFSIEIPRQEAIEGNLIQTAILVLKDPKNRDHPVKIEIGITDQSALVLVNINTDTKQLQELRRSTRNSLMIEALRLIEEENLSIAEAEQAAFNADNPLRDALTQNRYLSISSNPNRLAAVREALTEALQNVLKQGFTLKNGQTIESVTDEILQALQQSS